MAAPRGARRAASSAAADALRADPVYVDPGAELAGQVDAAALRARIDAQGAAPLFIAVLPESAIEGSAGRTLIALREAVGESGAYALAVGDEFRTIPAAPGETARAAHPDDLQAALIAFVDRTSASAPRDDGGGGGRRDHRRRRARPGRARGRRARARRRRVRSRDGRSEVGEIDQTDDFVRLGDGIRALELDVTLGDAGPAAKADYDRAVEAYDRANAHDRRGDEDGGQPGARRGPGGDRLRARADRRPPLTQASDGLLGPSPSKPAFDPRSRPARERHGARDRLAAGRREHRAQALTRAARGGAGPRRRSSRAACRRACTRSARRAGSAS